MTIFFISDLHLNEQFPDSCALFYKFFNTLPEDTKAVYILGDLFEVWIDDRLNNTFLESIKNILKSAAEKFPVYFIRGNRDFLIGKLFAKQTNIKILPDIHKISLYGHNVLLIHGDSLCSLDKKHIYFTKIIRNPITVFIANLLPIKLKILIANKLRSISKNKYKNNDAAIYDVCQDTVAQIMQQYSADIMIHGHTHKPNVYNYKHFIRIVLSDWHDNAQILVFHSDGYELKNICLK